MERELCKNCGNRLRKRTANCLNCGQIDQAIASQLHKEQVERKQHRSAHQAREFEEKFDEKAIEIISSYLKTKADHLTISELIGVLESEQLMEEFQFADSYKRKNQWQAWSTRRAIGLAKFLHVNGQAFLGAMTTHGHPYLLYLPSHIPSGVVPFNPDDSSSKAKWSIRRLTKARKALLKKEKPQEESGAVPV